MVYDATYWENTQIDSNLFRTSNGFRPHKQDHPILWNKKISPNNHIKINYPKSNIAAMILHLLGEVLIHQFRDVNVYLGWTQKIPDQDFQYPIIPGWAIVRRQYPKFCIFLSIASPPPPTRLPGSGSGSFVKSTASYWSKWVGSWLSSSSSSSLSKVSYYWVGGFDIVVADIILDKYWQIWLLPRTVAFKNPIILMTERTQVLRGSFSFHLHFWK